MMRKRDWFTVISLVIAAWGIDQVTKLWAERTLSTLEFFGPFGLVLHHNPGAILGAFSDLPPVLRIVSLSTGGVFLIFIYAAIQYLLPSRSMPLRVGLSLLLGGILGNVTDRILRGAVTDFLVLGSFEMPSPAFNFADAIQWVGYGLVVFGLMRDGSLFWPDTNARKSIWVNPSFQLRYCLLLIGIGLCFSAVVGVFAYTYLKITIDDLVIGPAAMMEHRFLVPFLVTFAVITFGFLLALFIIGRILSHRVAGPVYAFELYLRDLIQGRDRAFRLRSGDEFQHLEVIARELRPVIKQAVEKGQISEHASEELARLKII
jgi:signal peptidase II